MHRTRHQRSSLNWLALIFCGLLTACTTMPVAEGTHHSLPGRGTLVAVWGDQSTIEQTAVLWLSRQGLSVVDPAHLRENIRLALAARQSPDAIQSVINESDVLEAGQRLGVKETVFVRHGGETRAPAVFVTAIVTSTRQVAWIGSAWYRTRVAQPFPVHLVLGTCYALEAAWAVGDAVPGEGCGTETAERHSEPQAGKADGPLEKDSAP